MGPGGSVLLDRKKREVVDDTDSDVVRRLRLGMVSVCGLDMYRVLGFSSSRRWTVRARNF